MSMVPPTPRKPPVVTQDSRSPLRRELDALANTWRQSGIGNYLPSPNEVGRGVASFLFPTAIAAGRDVKPTDFLGDAALAFAPVGLGNTGRLSAIVRRLNKSTDVGDFMTDRALQNRRPNDAFEGLYRPGAQSFDYENVPQPASEYLFGLVPTEKLAPLREFDRWNTVTEGSIGRGNVKKLMEHLAEGGKWSDPLAVKYYPETGAGYLAEGNHRLAMAEQLGLEQLPTTLWRASGELSRTGVGRNLGDLDTNQLARHQFPEFLDSVGPYYVPPDMHPYLLKYFQPR